MKIFANQRPVLRFSISLSFYFPVFLPQCEPGLGASVMYNLLYNAPQKLMLLAGCSTVCTTVAEAAKMWNLVVVSPGKHLYTTHFLFLSFFACFVSFSTFCTVIRGRCHFHCNCIRRVSFFFFTAITSADTFVCVHVVNEFLNISRSADVLKGYPTSALRYSLVSFPLRTLP